ncbi:MAG TPA: hypothetical protein VMR52_07215 [Dehalococcoidia bacterium]|nr:hypothetical protein [Dehalococcoidia bacterium]
MTLERAWSYAAGLALIGAVLLPLTWHPRDDSFPLSTYAMFSGRQSAEATIPHAIGYTAGGERVLLPPEAVANDEVVQAFETLRQAVSQGKESTDRLCARAAGWAERRDEVVSVAIVSDTFDAVRYFDGDKDPVRTVVHSECEVAR